MGGGDDRRRVSEYNPRTNTWRHLPSLQKERFRPSVCTLDNKIFALGDGSHCEMLDLSDDDPQWRNIAKLNSLFMHFDGGAVVIEGKIYLLSNNDADVEVYDVDQGMMRKYLPIILFDIYRSVEHCYQHAN